MRRLQALLLIVVLTLGFVGGLMLTDSKRVEAAKCCWVMVCGPVGCWEVCRPCPRL